MGAEYRNVEQLARQHIRRTHTASDHRSPRAVGACVRSLRPAKAELHHRAALGRVTYTRRLCGDQGLMVDDIEDRGLHQLRFHDRSDDLEKRFLRENHSSFRDRPDIARETEVQKVFQKVLVKCPRGAQIINIILVEAKSLHVVDHLVKAGTDRVAAAVRIGTVEGIKHDLWISSCLEITLHHGQLIEVGEKCQLHGTHSNLHSAAG